MGDNISKEDTIDVSDLTLEEKEKAWETWVKNEVNAALDMYLPVSKLGHVNLSYSPVVVEQTEAGPVYSENLKQSVMISLIFDFEKPIDITSPREVEEEQPSDE